jgi:drug/metabolite transporter (DMT)-like permease
VALLLPRFVPTERLRTLQWTGLVIAFAAVTLAFAEGLFGQAALPRQLRGDAVALLGGLLWGLTTLVIRSSRLATVSAEKTLFYQVAVTAAVAPLLSIALGETWSFSYSATAWGSIGLQTVVGAFASYLLWMDLLRKYPATKLGSFTFLTPVFALVFGVVLLNEPLTPQLVLALAGVAVGIVLVNRKPAA